MQVFNQVQIDLIAPNEIGLPQTYYQEMVQNGFKIRLFTNIDEYLQQQNIAPIWYFTRLQLERMDSTILRREQELRYNVTLRLEHLPILQKIQQTKGIQIKFYHPMPRHKQFPVLPPFLDHTPYNGWEQQSTNGLILRITLLALIAGLRPITSKSKTLSPPEKKTCAPILYQEST